MVNNRKNTRQELGNKVCLFIATMILVMIGSILVEIDFRQGLEGSDKTQSDEIVIFDSDDTMTSIPIQNSIKSNENNDEKHNHFHSTRSEPGTISVEGFCYYADEYWDGDPMEIDEHRLPIRNIKVNLMDYDPDNNDDILGTTYTNGEGKYIFENIENTDEDDGGTLDIYLELIADSDTEWITYADFSLFPYTYKNLDEIAYDVEDGDIVDFDLTDVSDVVARGIWNIHNLINEEGLWFESQVGWKPGRVKVVYPWYESNFAHPSEIIHITENDAWYPPVPRHEYGHYIMWEMYDEDYPDHSYEGTHYLWTEADGGHALGEGWAEFIAAAVEKNATIYYPFSRIEHDEEGHTIQIFDNLEKNHWEKVEDSYESTGDIEDDFDGHKIEGCVASIFWDIFDGDIGYIDVFIKVYDENAVTIEIRYESDEIDVSGYDWVETPEKEPIIEDEIHLGIYPIYQVLKDNKPNNIKEFWDGWFDNPNYDTTFYTHWMKAIYYNHGVKITAYPESSPYFRQGLSIYNGPYNGYYSGNIRLDVRVGENDLEDKDYLRVRYQYSVDNGETWHDIVEIPACDDDLIQYWWDTEDPEIGAPDGEIIVRAVLDDDMREVYSEKSINIDNTPPTTYSSLDGTLGDNGWYVSDVSVYLWAEDETSGVEIIKYRIDGGSWQTFSFAFEITSEEIHTLEYYSRDIAGNIEGINSVEIKIDKTPPSIPIVSSPTHPEGIWSHLDDPIFNWEEPFDQSGNPDLSGIAGYSYILDQYKWTLPDEISEGESTTASYYDYDEGIWYFHIRAVDNAGNWAYPQEDDEWYYEIRIDITPPEIPIISSLTHGEDVWEFDNDPVFAWTEPYDLNGISGYSYSLDYMPYYIPDSTIDGTERSKSYKDVDNGIWYFHVRAIDIAGNPGPTDHYKIKIDSQAPISIVEDLPPYENSLTFDIPFLAVDYGGSGFKYVELWYRVDTGNGFCRWTLYEGTYTSSPITFTAPSDGIYEFYTIATDNAGQKEDGPIWVGHSTDFQNKPNKVAWGDLNNDEYLDLAIIGGCNNVHVYLNDNGMLENVPIWSEHELSFLRDVTWCDLDNDGYQDIFITGLSGGNYHVYGYQNFNGVLDSAHTWMISDSCRIYSIAWGDFDNDGDLDLVIGTEGTNKIYRNIGGNLESTPYWISDDSIITFCVAWGDVDDDGDLDLAAGNNRNIVIYLNNGGTSGEFLTTTPSWQSDIQGSVDSIAWGDVNGDGYLDLAVGRFGQNKLYINIDGSLETSPSWSSEDSWYTQALTFGDVNADEKLDLIAGDEPTYIYFNIGNTLESVPSWNIVDPLRIGGVGLGDMDNDGLQDRLDVFFGDDSRKIFYLTYRPIHSIQEITVDGASIPLSDYCVDYVSGWISFKNAPSSWALIFINYKYSTDLEIASAGWNYQYDVGYVTVYEYSPRFADTSTIVDTTPPEIPIISSLTHPSQTTWYSDNDPCFEWTEPYDLNGIAGYSYILDKVSDTDPDTNPEGSMREKSYVDLEDDIWYFHVRALDNAGNWGGTCHYTVKIDMEPPTEPTVISDTHPEGVWTSDDHVYLEWYGPTSDLSGIADYSYIFNDIPDTFPDTDGEGLIPYHIYYYDVDDGIWYFHIRAEDNAENWGATRHYCVKIDTEGPPAPTISSSTHPDENAWYENNDPEFTWNVPPDLSGIDGYSIALDQNPNYPLDSIIDTYDTFYSYTDIEDGIWYFFVKAIDNAGNDGSKDSYRIKIDTTAPSAPIITSPTHEEDVWTSDNDPRFEWTTPDDAGGIAGYSYILDLVSDTIPDTVSEGLATTKSYNNIADGIWYFHVRALDNSGKWGDTDHYKIKIDITPPEIIIGPDVALVTETTATIEWTTDELTDSYVRYATEEDGWIGDVTDPTYVTEHNIMITGLSLDQEYIYQVKSTDYAGNEVLSDYLSLTIKKIDTFWYPDTSEPIYELEGYTFIYPPFGEFKIFYMKIPKTGRILSATFWLAPDYGQPELPLNPTMDIGNDGTVEWSIIGEFGIGLELYSDKYTEPQIIQAIQNYIDDPSNQPDSEGFIYMPIKLSSDSESGIALNIEVFHVYQYVWATYEQDNPDQTNPSVRLVSVDIRYTGSGGLEITFVTDSEFQVHSTIADDNWEKPAHVKSHYTDENNDGIVDGTTIPESTLKMYWWNDTLQEWVLAEIEFGAENTGVNVVDNYVWANVDHFSNFTIKGSYVPIIETEVLIDILDGMDIHHGIKISLRAKLEAALTYLNAAQNHFIIGDLDLGNENLTLAENKLNDFINEVETLRGLMIREEDADILINNTQEIIALIDEAYV